MDFHSTAAASVRESIYMPCTLDVDAILSPNATGQMQYGQQKPTTLAPDLNAHTQ